MSVVHSKLAKGGTVLAAAVIAAGLIIRANRFII